MNVLMICMASLPDESMAPKFKLFFEEYKVFMGKIAYDYIHDYHIAEDCVMDTMHYFARTFDKIGEIKCNKTLMTVITVTRERAINFYKKQSKINQNEQQIFDEAYEHILGFDDNVFSNVETIELVSCIDSLDDKYKIPLILKISDGYTSAEIAEILGISESLVRKRIERAKNKLICKISVGEG